MSRDLHYSAWVPKQEVLRSHPKTSSAGVRSQAHRSDGWIPSQLVCVYGWKLTAKHAKSDNEIIYGLIEIALHQQNVRYRIQAKKQGSFDFTKSQGPPSFKGTPSGLPLYQHIIASAQSLANKAYRAVAGAPQRAAKARTAAGKSQSDYSDTARARKEEADSCAKVTTRSLKIAARRTERKKGGGWWPAGRGARISSQGTSQRG